MRIAIVSGYFDPLHRGHLELIRRAKKYGEVHVIINNNKQCRLKKDKPFMDELERAEIVTSLKDISGFMISIDESRTVEKSLATIRAVYPYSEMVFVNGDEYTKKNCAEHKTCLKLGIKPIYGEGKKIQSSSWLLKK